MPVDVPDEDVEDVFAGWEREALLLAGAATDAAVREAWERAFLEVSGARPGRFDPEAQEFMRRYHFAAIRKISAEEKAVIRRVLLDSVQQGLGVEEAVRALRVEFDARRARLRAIARTELNRAANWGRLQGYIASGVVEEVEWSATFDDRVRPDHLASDGNRSKPGRPFTGPGASRGLVAPPAGVNCVIPGQRVQGNIEAASRMPYDGPTKTFITSQGNRLTVTVNHPILTDKGFTAAHSIHEGDQMVRYLRGDGAVNEHPDDAPFIEQLFDAFSVSAPSGSTSARGEFHGDAVFGKGDVEVAMAPSVLLDCVLTAAREEAREEGLAVADVGPALHAGPGASFLSPLGVGVAPARLPGGSGLALDGIGAGGFDGGPFEALRFGSAPDFDARGLETIREGLSDDSGVVADRLEALAGLVSFDEVVEVIDGHYSGHVYDLQASKEAYWCNDIIIHNCRCALIPVTDLFGGLEAAKAKRPRFEDVFPFIDDQVEAYEEDLDAAWTRLFDRLSERVRR